MLFPYVATCFRWFGWMNDEWYLKLMFRAKTGKRLNLDNPQTFNEKLQWLKLYDRKEIYTEMVDKYEVKKYVKEKIGSKYIIPTYGVWNHFEDINFEILPDQFVLKTTHDSGGVVICKDKTNFNVEVAKRKINKSLRQKFYLQGREWPYKNVKPRILAEKYMEDNTTKKLHDYKFFCFDGVPKVLLITSDKENKVVEPKSDFFDMDFHHMKLVNGYPNATRCPEKPKMFYRMQELAAELSKNIPQIRVDFYEVDGEIYFGELTFFHWSGMTPFKPEYWDRKFGEWITLPEVSPKG
ncbi:glycosyl transferase [Lachnospiraceae bacterium DSM 108991]|uniref:Glycosyl transferase n=2 Tax=Claveliimonas monacensis TaxID=2779351 RepID=A0ABR9RLM9_9FIRM|nr:glycosyl transferase [Claveliimonas monacensis]